MARRYDEAAREAGKAELERVKAQYPVGSYVLIDDEGLARVERVKGHKLNMAYKPLIVVSGTVYYPGEVRRVLNDMQAELLAQASEET